MCSWNYLVGARIRGSSKMTCNCWMGPWVVWKCVSGWCKLHLQQLLSVLVYGGLHWACDTEPSIMPLGWHRQPYIRCATLRARASHALLARQPRRSYAYSVTQQVPYRAMATMDRQPRQPCLPQTLPVTLQPLICTYKATHQSGGQLPLYNATDIITHSQHLAPQWRPPVSIILGVLRLNTIHADPHTSWWQWAVAQLGNIGSCLPERVML